MTIRALLALVFFVLPGCSLCHREPPPPAPAVYAPPAPPPPMTQRRGG